MEHHGRGLRSLTSEAFVRALIGDWTQAAMPDRLRAMLHHAVKLTRTPWLMTEEDIERLRGHGLSDRDVVDLNQVVAYYAYVNRVADGLGVALEMPAELSRIADEPPSAVQGVSEIVLWVDNLNDAVAFYRDVLGFRLRTMTPGHFAFLQAGSGWAAATLALFVPRPDNASDLARAYLAERGGPRGRLYHVAFRLTPEALDAYAAGVEARGVAVRGPVVFDDGQRSYFLEDPDGHYLELTDR